MGEKMRSKLLKVTNINIQKKQFEPNNKNIPIKSIISSNISDNQSTRNSSIIGNNIDAIINSANNKLDQLMQSGTKNSIKNIQY